MANAAQSLNKDSNLRDLNARGRDLLHDAQDKASEYFEKSGDWVQENRVVTMLGVAAIAGLLGYFISRRATQPIDRTTTRNDDAIEI